MPETLCPSCGHSPIPRGAEACPKCHEPFDFLQMYKRGQRLRVDKHRDQDEAEQTVFGGNITGEVSAHPAPIAAVFFVGAVAWFLRAGGVLGSLKEPGWTYGLVVLDLALGLVLLISLGPAKQLAQVGMALQLGAAGYLARTAPAEAVHWAYLGHAVVALVAVTGEPGPRRRYACLGLGVTMALLGALFLAVPVGAGGKPDTGARQLLVGKDLGYQLELPAGWGRLSREQLAPHLSLPPASLTGGGVGFGDETQGRFGGLWVERAENPQPVAASCQELLKAFGGEASSRPATRPGPLALGTKALVYELRTASGASGSFSCGRLGDGRLVGFGVVAVPAHAASAEAAFVAVGSGLALQ
jgi:hypothetical protein